MHNTMFQRAAGFLIAAAILLTGMSPPVRALADLPDRISLRTGEQLTLAAALPLDAEVAQTGSALASAKLDRLADQGTPQLRLTAGQEDGEAELVFRLMGWLPLKRVNVSVANKQPVRLIPGGQSIGVALLTKGVVVVGASDLGRKPSPARTAGLKAGDRIVSINGTAISSAGQLADMVQDDSPCLLEIVREDKEMTVEITPALDRRDGSHRLGMWVRDSTAGIGTLSFYDPESGVFGALGHAVADVDTGIILPISSGGIYESRVTAVNKGRQGTPGELIGEFFDAETQMGEIRLNTQTGIFGPAKAQIVNPLYPDGLPIAARGEVHTGEAELLTTLTDGGITAYACEIERVDTSGDGGSRSLLVHITDPALLEATGGIVQGMSGSPLIQDGRIIGAVTHVLVNDPTRGYAVFIENMLAASRGEKG